jgi:hypothetical protein
MVVLDLILVVFMMKLNEIISYILDDGRKVNVTFIDEQNKTKIIEDFEAETTNSIELQQKGWQAILDNFKKYTEKQEFENISY